MRSKYMKVLLLLHELFLYSSPTCALLDLKLDYFVLKSTFWKNKAGVNYRSLGQSYVMK